MWQNTNDWWLGKGYMSIQCTILSTLCKLEHFLNKKLKLKKKKNTGKMTLEKIRLTRGTRENLKIYIQYLQGNSRGYYKHKKDCLLHKKEQNTLKLENSVNKIALLEIKNWSVKKFSVEGPVGQKINFLKMTK